MALGENIKRIAAEKKIPIIKLAKKAGVSRASIYNVIAGTTNASDTWVARIAAALGVEATKLKDSKEEGLWRLFQEAATAGEKRQTVSFQANDYDLDRLKKIREKRRVGGLKPPSVSALIRDLIRKEADRLGIVAEIAKNRHD